ncbi:MAG TPA: hypothetical protein VJ882_02970, partial [Desulfuromonadales bacterium]|nr:hypothetical protein [Desulfuromonadales bacterium]
MKLTNGKSQGDLRVSSGRIIVNGMEVFTPSSFNQQVTSIEREIILKDDNVLEVEIGGAPGSVVTMSIIGEETAPPPPAPTVTLTADPPSITSGESSTLSWMTLNAQRAWVEPGIGEVSVAGDVKVSPTQTTLYRLFAEGPGGQAQTEASVTVSAPPVHG